MRVVKEILLDKPNSTLARFLHAKHVAMRRIVGVTIVFNVQHLVNWHCVARSILQALTFLLFCASLKISLVLANEYPETIDTATIDFVKGDATVFQQYDDSLAVVIKRGMTIREQDRIVTGDDGFVSIGFASGIVVRIQPSSEVHAEQLDCSPDSSQCNILFNAVQGSINTNVEHLGNANVKFIIKTPYASAAVRGTVFDIDVKDGRLLTGVTEGQVNVIAETGTVELPENFGTKVLPNEPPTSPKPLLRSPALIPGPARYSKGGEFSWSQVPLASKYLIAFDNAQGLVYRTQLVDTTHKLKPLDLGSYAMHIRAIDEEGFLGNVAYHEFDMVSTNESRKGPNVKATTSASDFEITVEQQPLVGELVELQFSTSGEFDLLSSLDVTIDEIVSAPRAKNTIYVRARSVLSNKEVTLFGPTLEIPSIE